MKNKLLIFVSVLFVSAIFVQCGKDCAREECDIAPPPTFSFRLLNNANKDLLVGAAKQYDSANLKITAKRISNGNIENINRLFYFIGDTIATTGFTVNKNYSVYYLSLNNNVTDSMQFGYSEQNSGCCDMSNYYLSRFNTTDITGGLPLPITNGYTIRK
ncbi:MAG: hypothetical protein K2Q24_16010 [Chitinophagaceae bacterium]|nr:hypothetical protein [Chitinophagaceae bacterium]